MNIASIFTSLIGFASGGWGSFAAILVLVGGAIVVWKMVEKAKQDQAHQDTLDQAAVDGAHDIANNQGQAVQDHLDNSSNQSAHDQALADVTGKPKP